jgi:hypothetical protein
VPHLTKTTAANSLTGMKNAVSSLCLWASAGATLLSSYKSSH